MKGTHLPIEFARVPGDYAELCRLQMPCPIRDKVDLENVTGMTDALAGSGSFRTRKPSLHTTTNAEIIRRFLSVPISLKQRSPLAWQVSIGND